MRSRGPKRSLLEVAHRTSLCRKALDAWWQALCACSHGAPEPEWIPEFAPLDKREVDIVKKIAGARRAYDVSAPPR